MDSSKKCSFGFKCKHYPNCKFAHPERHFQPQAHVPVEHYAQPRWNAFPERYDHPGMFEYRDNLRRPEKYDPFQRKFHPSMDESERKYFQTEVPGQFAGNKIHHGPAKNKISYNNGGPYNNPPNFMPSANIRDDPQKYQKAYRRQEPSYNTQDKAIGKNFQPYDTNYDSYVDRYYTNNNNKINWEKEEQTTVREEDTQKASLPLEKGEKRDCPSAEFCTFVFEINGCTAKHTENYLND